MKEFMKEYFPIFLVGLMAGFSIGVLVNVWCLSTVIP